MKRKIFSILFALALVVSFSLIPATPVSAAATVAPTIDGVIDANEWDGATTIPVTGGGTVSVIAEPAYLYMLFEVIDSTDNRVESGYGNDKIAVNINPTPGEPWGMPCDIIFQAGTDPNSWNGVDCGTIDGYATDWEINGVQVIGLPPNLETKTLYSGGTRISEWKLPLATIAPSPGDTLKLGGACDNLYDGGGSYLYPVGLDWSNVATYAEYSLMVKNENTGLFYTTIQKAVDAASTDDVLTAYPGVYDEDVTIDVGVALGSAVEHEAVVEGTIVVNANGVTVGGFTITDFSQIPGPDWSGIYVPSGTGVVIANNSIGGSIDPVANLTVGIHTLYGGSADIVAHGNTIVNCRMGIYNQGAAMLIGSNTIENNAHCGIGVDTSLGTEIYENSIRYNAIGIEVFREGVVAHFNNICGNTLYGIWSAGPVVDAQNNYWCDPSGPSHSPGYGDPVSGDVLYNPWLLEPFVPGDPPPTFDKTLALNIGWTLVSTDNWIDAASVVGEGVVWALNYTPSLGWFEVDPAALVPVNALYLKMVAGGGLGFDYSGDVPVASSKDLEAGWNLISSATLTKARAVLSPLRYIDVGEEQGVGLATLVSQGPFNQHTGSFYLATLTDFDWNFGFGQRMLNPFDGYWAYMNDGKVFGVVPGH